MKNIVFFIAFFVFAFSNKANAEITSLTVGGDIYYPPYEYMDDNGVYKGFNVDITNAISLELGIDIEFEPMEWNDALERLRNGEVDALQGALISEERQQYFDFSEELLENSQVIFVRSDNQFIKEPEDLSGLKVAIQADDIAYERIRNVPDIEIYEFTSQEEAMEALLDAEVEAFVGDRLTGLYFAQKNRYYEDVKISGEVMETNPYAFAVLKGDEETLKLINEGIREIKANGTYQKIYRKWFGEEIADISKWRNLFYVTIASLLATLVFVLIMMYLNRVLKREVNKRTEQLELGKLELAKKDRLKGKIIENVQAGIIAFNPDGVITNINEFANQTLGLALKEGDLFNEVPLLCDLDFCTVKDSILEIPVEKEVVYSAGSEREKTLIYKLIPISEEEKADGYLLCIFDLTEERNLNRIIAHSDKMQSLGVLAAGIAHEIRNPLTSIKMFVDLVPIKVSDSQFIDKFANIVPSELNRLNELTTVLLDYSKPSKSQPALVRLTEVVENVLLLSRPHFKKRKIEIIKDYEDSEFWADPSQIKQILLNIILNSIDAIREYGEIKISSWETKDCVYIRIEDDGFGIDEKILPKVFDPFYTSKKYGYGIGLPITKNLVSENNGTIDIESEKDRGTVVTLSFQKKDRG